MEGKSSFDQQEKISHPSDQRQDARFRVDAVAHHHVKMIFGHVELEAECLDYSPFGLGLRLEVKPDLPLFSIGESVDLDCDFAGSRFRARGTVANTRVERTPEGDYVRLGVVLSRSAEVVRPAHVKRRSARIQMNESVSPLVVVSDHLRFGDAIFAKMIDVSHGGMKLIIDRHPLPFLEKQRHWFDIVLPVFGQCRAFCRIAYVRREENSNRYIVGCEFVDGGTEANLSALEDWLFYSNFWLTLADLRASGFSLAHLSANDEKFRVLVSASFYNQDRLPLNQCLAQSDGQNEGRAAGKEVEQFELSVNKETEFLQLTAGFAAQEKLLILENVRCSIAAREVFVSVWKLIMIFSLTNKISGITLSVKDGQPEFVSSTLTCAQTQKLTYDLMVEQLLAGQGLEWRIWRQLYRELQCKKQFSLPKVNSLFRRLMVF